MIWDKCKEHSILNLCRECDCCGNTNFELLEIESGTIAICERCWKNGLLQ